MTLDEFTESVRAKLRRAGEPSRLTPAEIRDITESYLEGNPPSDGAVLVWCSRPEDGAPVPDFT